MSQLNYYGADPRVALPHRGGLVAWGIVLIVLGGLAVLLTVFSLVFAIAMAANLIPGIKGQSPATFFVAIPVYTVARGLSNLDGHRLAAGSAVGAPADDYCFNRDRRLWSDLSAVAGAGDHPLRSASHRQTGGDTGAAI